MLEKGRSDADGIFWHAADLQMEGGEKGRKGVDDMEIFWNRAAKLEKFRLFMVVTGSPVKATLWRGKLEVFKLSKPSYLNLR